MAFQRNVVRKGGAGYEHNRRFTAFSDRVPSKYPEAIVTCRDENDVVAAVKIANDEGLQISVRSGGHHWNANHLRDGVVLIDMHNMSDYGVDVEANTAWAQPGLRGSDLNKALLEVDRFFPTGHCTDVCIGGYLLQGGVGWDNHRYGPACGSVFAVDVVTADGQLVHATDDNEYADLLWAARGAGAGFFGVVTKYYINLYPRRLAINSLYLFPSDCQVDVYRFAQQVGPDTPTEINMLTFWNTELDKNGPVVAMNAMAHTDTEEQAAELLKIYDDNPVLDKALVVKRNELTSLSETSSTGVDVHYMEQHRYAGDCIWTNASLDDTGPIFQEIGKTMTGQSHIMYTNFGSNTPAERVPMAFSGDDLQYYGIYAVWEDPAQDEDRRAWLLSHMKKLEPFSTGIALADENLENRWTKFMSDENFARLDELRAKYDPNGRFVQWLGRPGT